MLLRCSRISGAMTKEATAPLIQSAKNILGAAKGAGEFLKKHWKGAIAAGVAVPAAATAMNRSQQGMSDEAFQLRQEGLMPPGPPKVPKV